ncbi:uncharacterized protein LOC128204572 [Mya arenaria]|uniref:uncharacterized protein LOC128204572 n=1 Tax=Mya arenaria TaxID=6604 RepID=UPI0022E2AF06|nr:uncharacterized protein LOC128204572 [Mya arenaria]
MIIRKKNGKFTKENTKKRMQNLVQIRKIGECNLEGRRVVELKILIDDLIKCCKCAGQLSLTNITSETKYGLGSILHIKCMSCLAGKRHKASDHKTGTRCFDVNTKLAAAMINASVGEQQMNNILAYMNLPLVNKKTLKNREREIGESIEAVAAQSCSRAVEEEIRNSEETDDQWVEVSADGGWQKRGTGHSNNSLSGK